LVCSHFPATIPTLSVGPVFVHSKSEAWGPEVN
jgi:hypothetical protein